MHHHPRNRERALNLSILSVSGPGEVSPAGSAPFSLSGLAAGRPPARPPSLSLRSAT
ncbi:unnamed protein product, partial [Coccothraustes coccothraustes]